MSRSLVILLALVAGLFFVISFFFLFFFWYSKGMDLPSLGEKQRVHIDAAFMNWYNKRVHGGRFINDVIFGNSDKYSWYPPRVVPVTNPSGMAMGYEIFGLVREWNADTDLLTVHTYTRQTMVVRVHPELDQSIAIVSPIDSSGAIPYVENIQIVTKKTDAPWQTLFCPSDIVAIRVASKANFDSHSEQSPVVPTQVRLVRRLCAT